MMNTVKITKGFSGFGNDMYLTPDGDKVVLSLTSSNKIDPVAQKIADLLGVSVINGWSEMPDDEHILCVVINCGGSLRCGLYPQKKIKTINVLPTGQSGPLAQYITPDIYVSDVKQENVVLTNTFNVPSDSILPTSNLHPSDNQSKNELSEKNRAKPDNAMAVKMNFNSVLTVMTAFASGIGAGVSLLYASARESVDMCIKNVIPFMAFVSVLIAIVQETALGTTIAHSLTPLASSLLGLLVLSVICGLPFLSPILGPGAAIAQVVGVLIGTQIGSGLIPPAMAIPALFAINVQVGADFVPVGLSMQNAETETIAKGVPAFLLSRMVTGPLAVAIGYVFSIGLFS